MGVYDTIMIPCPKCGELFEAQSKSGECTLKLLSLEEEVKNSDLALYDINRHAPFFCDKCGTSFYVAIKTIANPIIKAQVLPVGEYIIMDEPPINLISPQVNEVHELNETLKSLAKSIDRELRAIKETLRDIQKTLR